MKKTTQNLSLLSEKNIHLKVSVFSFLLFFLFSNHTYSQYTEIFSTTEKGVLAGPCSGDSSTCPGKDFTGVNWGVTGDFTGLDSADPGAHAKTLGGVFRFGEIDAEVCWESPVLDISDVTGAVSFSIDVTWSGHDLPDYADAEYSIDEGPWIQVPTQFGDGGTGNHTIDQSTSNFTSSGTVTMTNIAAGADKLSVRFCARHTAAAEFTTIDNVSVPEVGVKLFSNNEAPVATAAAPVVLEDATNVALPNTFQVTDTDTDDQTLTFTITGGTVTLGTSGISFGGSGNGSASFTAQGTLANINAALDAATFTPTANLNGTNAGSIAFVSNDGTIDSNNASITFNITPVNDEPSFTIGVNQSVNEDAGAQTVNNFITNDEDGDAEETQNLSYNLSNNNNGLFSSQPAVDAFGNLTYTPAADLFGTATVSINIMDDGGTANGGDDTSANQTFTITVNQVNDTTPIITSISDDTGSSTTDYITNDNTPTVNGTAEPGSTITLVVNGTSTALFGITATTNSSGVFAFPFPAAFGSLPNATATLSADATFNGTTLSSSNQPVTVDRVDPTTPTVVAQTTNDTTPTITGTNALGTALPTGETMTVGINGAIYNVIPNGSGDWSIEIGTDMPASGSVGNFINGVSFEVVATVTDLAGNTATDISNFEITIDTANPTVAITSTENSPTVNQSFPISITFSEVVTDFELIDISVGNGTASNLATADDITFTATITATADGVVTVDVANGVAQDIAGNDNEAASEFSISFEDPALSIGDNTLQANDFNFVNPVGNELIINSPIIINEITLYSLSGTIVAFVKGNIVDTSSLASGIYIASIVSEKGTSATVKIVKK